jgi:hypothetical protein
MVLAGADVRLAACYFYSLWGDLVGGKAWKMSAQAANMHGTLKIYVFQGL